EPGETADLALSALWGLVRSAQSEHPGRFALIDLPGVLEASDQEEAGQLAAAFGNALYLVGDEPQLAVRPGGVFAPRLTRAVAAPELPEDVPSKLPAETVLITGGTGGLGALLAVHLAKQNKATKLVLASRRGSEAPGAAELAQEIEQLGLEAELVASDISDPEQAIALIKQANADGKLTGVIHAAGVLDDGIIESMSSERIDRVFAPKVSAAYNLHQATKNLELTEFTLFSSAAGVFGSPGQANYAAANSFLDALAGEREAEGLPATSIAWGLWQQEEGMGGELSKADRVRIERAGSALTPELGLELYDYAQLLPQSVILAMQLDRKGLAAQARAGMLLPLLSGLVRIPASRKFASGSLA
ncbi:beta-ketoacyl reductase, partial [Aquabacterium sp.]|uniref:beta-ketoacyl reductase n=1 Tax=Aquabacterium sp. TaxID=1872578 RepID=UPI003D6C76CB